MAYIRWSELKSQKVGYPERWGTILTMAQTSPMGSSIITTSNESSVDTEMGGLDYLSRLSKAKHVFKRGAKLYLKKRQPPTENEVKELWEFSNLLELTTVLKWRESGRSRY